MEFTPLAAMQRASARLSAPRDFGAALEAAPVGLVHGIAETKRKSPSAGILIDDYDPVRIALNYFQNGASAISVLTDAPYFGGAPAHVTCVKAAVGVPVLRKDFILTEWQVYESAILGADAILLIAEAMDITTLLGLYELVRQLRITPLIEVHEEKNLILVLERLGSPGAGSYVLGINNRDLSRQRTDLATTERLSLLLPAGAWFISESGIRTLDDVRRVRAAGAKAVLVGESLLSSPKPGEQLREILGLRSLEAPPDRSGG